MTSKHFTFLSIAACAIIVPLMIYVALPPPQKSAKTAPTIAASDASPIKSENTALPVVSSGLPTVSNVRVRTTVPGARVSAAYMEIAATQALTLIRAETKIAGITEIHSMAMRDGVMEMRALEKLDIPANTAVKLERGGLHVMLLQLNTQINAGDKVPLALTFQGPDGKPFKVDVEAVAETFGPAAGAASGTKAPAHQH